MAPFLCFQVFVLISQYTIEAYIVSLKLETKFGDNPYGVFDAKNHEISQFSWKINDQNNG